MKNNEDRNDAVPTEFQAIFRDLVMALQPRGLERGAVGVYWDTLSEFSMPVLRESSYQFRRSSTFFPSTGEWFQAAVKCRAEHLKRGKLNCEKCGDCGVIRVTYHSGEPFDLAICDCLSARFYRKTGPEYVAERFGLTAAQCVRLLEEFHDENDADVSI